MIAVTTLQDELVPALLQMCQHLEQITRTIEMTVAPMLQTATASKVGCCDSIGSAALGWLFHCCEPVSMFSRLMA